MNNQNKTPLTAEMIETRVWAFVVIVVTMILAIIVISFLYSITFVEQPIKTMSPIDQAYTKMLNDIVLLIVGGIGGIMGKKGVGAASNYAANKLNPPPQPPSCYPPQQVPPQGYSQTPQYAAPQYAVPPSPTPSQNKMPDFNWMGYVNPELDESWTPGPPPTTEPDHLEDDEYREEIAVFRKEENA